MSNRNWHEEREQWEQDRALYELELQKAYAEASNRRARWLMAAFACHAMTAMLMVGWRAFLAVSLAAVSAALLSRVHVIENEAARSEIKQKLGMKFPEHLTPRPPED
jgi:hypothetical protein